jgi:hypothetical protein
VSVDQIWHVPIVQGCAGVDAATFDALAAALTADELIGPSEGSYRTITTAGERLGAERVRALRFAGGPYEPPLLLPPVRRPPRAAPANRGRGLPELWSPCVLAPRSNGQAVRRAPRHRRHEARVHGLHGDLDGLRRAGRPRRRVRPVRRPRSLPPPVGVPRWVLVQLGPGTA